MFNITCKRGFQVTFENGWTVSVQWGPGNYCERQYDNFDAPEKAVRWTSNTAEIAAWDANNEWHDFGGDTVEGYVKPDDVLAFMKRIAKKPASKKK